MAVTAGPRDYGGAAVLGRGSVASRQASFFDADVVLRAMDRTTHKALSKFGAFVRQRARTSLRYKTGVSAPGQPPHAHKTMSRNKTNRQGVTKRQSSSPLRDFTYFSYDRQSKAVVIGPAKTNQQNAFGMHEQTITEVIEYGGTVGILEYLRKGYEVRAGTRGRDGKFRPAGWVPDEWRRVDLRSPRRAAGRPQRVRQARYAARPWMGPAFEAELPQLIRFFREEGF